MGRAKKTQKQELYSNQYLQLGAAVFLFLVTVLLSVGHDMTAWEISVFNWIYGLPSIFLPPLIFITQSGTVYFALALIAFLIFKKMYLLASQVTLGAAIAYNMSGLAKGIWGRPRPNTLLDDVSNRDWSVYGPGFPSGHVALGAAIAIVLLTVVPKKFRPYVLLWIALLMVSRIYLGIHAPLDVLAGAAIGWGADIIALIATKKYYSKTKIKVKRVFRARTAR